MSRDRNPSQEEKVGREAEQIILTLPGGVTLRSAGEEYELGSYVRFCDEHGQEFVYWDKQEWADEPHLVMGAILAVLKDPAKRPEPYPAE